MPGEMDAGAVRTRARHGDRLFQQRSRACRVAGVEVVLGCRDEASRQPFAVLGWCQLPGQLQQLGGRVRSSPGARVPARLLQRSRHMHVGTTGREGKVPRPLLRIIDELRQAAMHSSRRPTPSPVVPRPQRPDPPSGGPWPPRRGAHQRRPAVVRQARPRSSWRSSGTGSGSPGPGRTPPGEGPSDLESEERVSFRDPV
jgi:hypothetical protein